MRDGYAVVIEHMGEEILRIDPSMLAGKADLTDDDTRAIRDAGEHLLAFAGPERFVCFACGGEDGKHLDCPIFQPA